MSIDPSLINVGKTTPGAAPPAPVPQEPVQREPSVQGSAQMKPDGLAGAVAQTDQGVRTTDGVVTDQGPLAAVASLMTLPVRAPVIGLKYGIEAMAAVDSYALSRPASTVMQAITPDNPLYADGFSLSDFRDMWNASETISPGEAAVNNAGFPWRVGNQWGKSLTNDPNFDIQPGMFQDYEETPWYKPGFNIYDPVVQEQLDKNVLWNYSSGAADFAWQTFAAGKGFGAIANGIKRGAGLATKVSSARSLQMIEDATRAHWEWIDSGKKVGKPTEIGGYVERLREATTANEVARSPLVSQVFKPLEYGPINRLLTETTDRETVLRLVLADRGHVPSMRALFASDPDHAWYMTNMSASLRAKVLAEPVEEFDELSGMVTQRHFGMLEDDDIPMLNAVFDKAIDRDETWRILRDRFLTISPADEAGKAVRGGPGSTVERAFPEAEDANKFNAFKVNNPDMPMLGPGGKVQDFFLGKKVDVQLGNPGNGLWNATFLGIPGAGRPVTVLLNWLGGKRPLNLVTYSSMRPNDVVEEMMAYFNTLRGVKGYNSQITVARRVADGEGKPGLTAIGDNVDPRLNPAGAETANYVRVNETSEMWRKQAIGRLSYAIAQGESATAAVVQELEAEILSHLMYRHTGFGTDAGVVRGIIKGFTDKRNMDVGTMRQAGFWMDEQANRVLLTPQFARQLEDSHFLLPLEEVDRQLYNLSGQLGRHALNGKAAIDKGYNFVQKFWRTSILFKPGYTVKNSIAEPLISAVLSHGSLRGPFKATEVLKNYWTNRMNGLRSIGYSSFDRMHLSGLSRVSKQITDLHQQRVSLQHQLEDAQAEVMAMDLRSPAYKHLWNDRARADAELLQQQLDEVQGQLDVVDPGWAKWDASPSTIADIHPALRGMTTALTKERKALEADLQTAARKDLYGGTHDIDVAATKRKLSENEAKAAKVRALEDSLKEWQDNVALGLYTDDVAWLRKIGDDIVKTEKELGLAEIRQGKLLAKRAKARERVLTGAKSFKVEVDGQAYIVPPIFGGPLGDSFRAEFSAALTQQQAMDPLGMTRLIGQIMARQGEPTILKVGDPGYWDELAYIANRHVRGDALGQRILWGPDKYRAEGIGVRGGEYHGKAHRGVNARKMDTPEGWKDAELIDDQVNWFYPEVHNQPHYLAEFMDTAAGREYARKMGWTFEEVRGMGVQRVDKLKPTAGGKPGATAKYNEEPKWLTAERLIHQYFPDPAVRARIAQGEITAGELRALMEPHIDQLGPIHAAEWTTVIDGRLKSRMDQALNRIWRLIATLPEERIGRFPWAQREYADEMAKRISLLKEQGVVMSPQQINGLRSQVARDVLAECEQTFYNIRRYSNPVYAMRYLMGFPGAYFNSLYRMARLTYKNPGRAMMMSNFVTTAFSPAHALDSEGNKVTDWKDADHVMLSVPQYVADKLGIDQNLSISMKSYEFAMQDPNFGWTVTIPVNTYLSHKPMPERDLKALLGEETFNMMFPYGMPSNANDFTLGELSTGTMIPGWAKDLYRSLRPSDEAFVANSTRAYQYLLGEWQKNPAVQEWMNGGQQGDAPIAPPTPDEAAELAKTFYRYNALVKFLLPGGISSSPAGQQMRDKWQQTMDEENSDFDKAFSRFLDENGQWAHWYTYSTSQKSAAIPFTDEAIDRFNKYPDLIRDVVGTSPDNPEIALLMFADAWDGPFNPLVYDFLANASLPGDPTSQPIRRSYRPEDWYRSAETTQAWKTYFDAKATRDATMLKYGYKSLRPTGETAWLYQQWHSWLDEFSARDENEQWLSEKNRVNFARASQFVTGLQKITGNQEFMSEYGNNPMWSATTRYLTELEKARAYFEGAQTPEARDTIQQNWDAWVTANILPTSGEFARVYDRYLAEKDVG